MWASVGELCGWIWELRQAQGRLQHCWVAAWGCRHARPWAAEVQWVACRALHHHCGPWDCMVAALLDALTVEASTESQGMHNTQERANAEEPYVR